MAPCPWRSEQAAEAAEAGFVEELSPLVSGAGPELLDFGLPPQRLRLDAAGLRWRFGAVATLACIGALAVLPAGRRGHAETTAVAGLQAFAPSPRVEGDTSIDDAAAGGRAEVRGLGPETRSRYDVQGRSVYMVMTDRFNRVGGFSAGNAQPCTEGWCNGTFKGIEQRLPYIKGMGFDCIWITPIVENPAVEDWGGDCGSGWAYHGYWAQNYYETDPHFGGKHEFKELVQAAHEAGLCVMLDIVMNHMGPIHPSPSLGVSKKVPFDKPEYYHQVGRGDQTWDEYTGTYCAPFAAAQSLGPGTLCKLGTKDGKPDYTNGGHHCNNFEPANGPYTEENYLKTDAAGPSSLKYCGLGDYCPGYNQSMIWDGWFFDLSDLNHSHPFVVEKQLEWIRWIRQEFDIDAIRLDTAPYMPWDYLAKLQDAAQPMQIHGEVTTSNVSFHASFQHYRDEHGGFMTLAGMQNFPPFFAATAGFCGDDSQPSSPVAMWDLRVLGSVMEEQLQGPYTNVQSLMTMADNQDCLPVAATCSSDTSRIKNILTWVHLCYGMPTVLWGTEQGNTMYRNSLWQYEWDTETWEYKFIRTLNKVRKSARVSLMHTEVVHVTKDTLIFKRYASSGSVWVYTNSRTGGGRMTYPRAPPTPALPSNCWVDALTGSAAELHPDGSVGAPSTEPLVLVLGRCP